MSQFSTLKSFFLAGAALTLVAACGDADISSPGEGDFIGTPPGGGGGGGGGSTTDLTFGGCPGGTSAETVPGTDVTACRVLLDGNGNILQNLILTASASQRRAYFFDQAAFVGTDDGPTASGGGGTTVDLTIQPGAQLAFLNPTDFLTVNRGSRLIANGTATAPIVFTSEEDLADDGIANDSQGDERGQWGGLIINGRANINNCANPAIPATCETSGEGGTGNYGGDDNADDSGSLRYVRVQYAGFEITPDNELNGIAFQGVGDTTQVNFIQVHNNDDDGVEFFGGSVDVRHVVVTGVDDDAVDWVAGWDGTAQYVLVKGSGVGDNGFEGDNNGDSNDVLPRSNPIFANFTLIGGPEEDLGMQIREGTAGTFINGVVDGWTDGCLDIDDDATYAQIDSGALDAGDVDLQIDFTTFACDTPFVSGDGDESAANTLDNSTFPGVQVITSSLIEGTPLPGPNESGATSTDPSAFNADFDPENYVGAFEPGLIAEETWAFGWTVPGSIFEAGCPDHPNVSDITATSSVTPPPGGAVCEVFGTITSDLTLTPFNRYALRGAVFVGEDAGPDAGNAGGTPANLTVQAGTTVFGVSPTDFLVINRGSQINANGSEGEPIIFTSDDDLRGLNTVGDERGQWGGLIINGRAQINNCANPAIPATCETSGEGGTGNYGGNANNDDSGALNYVRVQFAGFEITPDNELNGIAFQGVGDATDVNFIQVHNNDDDGVEFFGGTVDVKYVVLTGVDDDALDWVAGWDGSAQYVLIAGSGAGDNGFEGDNNGDNNTVAPVSNPTIANWTAIGGPSEDLGMQIREGTAGTFVNGVVSGWEDGCLDIDNDATFANINSGAVNANSVVDLQIDATLFSCANNFVDPSNDPGDAGDQSAGNVLDNSDFPGVVTDTSTLTIPAGFNTAIINGANENAVTPIDPSTIDPALDPVDTVNGRIGLQSTAGDNWFENWTFPGSF